MSKRSTTFSVTGTSGNDILRVPSGATIFNTTFDGGRGSDTLDLSTYATKGVTVQLLAGTTSGSSVTDQAFTGTPFSNPVAAGIRGSIKNVENLIGSSGNDRLHVDISGVVTRIEGGAGNDALSASSAVASATLVGGTGSDWLNAAWGPSAITLVGGTLDSAGAHGDGETDFFDVGPQATILDFESGIDRLIFRSSHSMDAAFAAGTWVSDGRGGSTFIVNGSAEVTLAGITPEVAANIEYGFHYVPESGILYGSSGDDLLQCNAGAVDRVIVDANSNDDIVTGFDKANDIIQLQDGVQPIWSDTFVNGAKSLLGVFTGGSITLVGLTTADLSAMHIEGVTDAPLAQPALSPWSVGSDYLLMM